MIPAIALVQPISSAALAERRESDRHDCKLEAISRPLDGVDAMWWGATVRDLSSTGIGLTLCYPFPAGAYLAVDFADTDGRSRSLLSRVVHAQDMNDGTWHIGCEFVKPLTDSAIELMI